jgi:hypothetical protein
MRELISQLDSEHQVSFLNRSRAEGKRGILRSTTSRGARTTSLAGRFTPSPMTGYEYGGGSDAERTGGRRNRCLSLRPVGGGAGAGITRSATSAPAWPLRSGGSEERNELASAGCCWCWCEPAPALAGGIVTAVSLASACDE